MNYLERLIMRNTGGSDSIRPIPNRSHVPSSHPDPLGFLERNNELPTELMGGRRQDHRTEGSHPYSQEWKRPAKGSMDASSKGTRLHEGQVLLSHSSTQPANEGKAQGVEKHHIESFADPVHTSSRGAHAESDNRSSQADGHVKTSRGETGGGPSQSGSMNDLRRMPLQPQSRPKDPSPLLASSKLPQNPMPAALRTSESDKFSRRQSETPAPEIHITIARVEVRATVSQTPTSKGAAKPSAMSLDEYLKQRREGRR